MLKGILKKANNFYLITMEKEKLPKLTVIYTHFFENKIKNMSKWRESKHRMNDFCESINFSFIYIITRIVCSKIKGF